MTFSEPTASRRSTLELDELAVLGGVRSSFVRLARALRPVTQFMHGLDPDSGVQWQRPWYMDPLKLLSGIAVVTLISCLVVLWAHQPLQAANVPSTPKLAETILEVAPAPELASSVSVQQAVEKQRPKRLLKRGRRALRRHR